VSLRVEGLEKENNRLARDLEKILQQKKQPVGMGTPGPYYLQSNSVRSTPNEPPSSARPIGIDETTSVTREKYHVLVSKFNAVAENHKDLKEARSILQELLEKEKEKNKSWYQQHKSQQEELARKDEKIQRQGEEIQRLRSQLEGNRGTNHSLEAACGSGSRSEEIQGEHQPKEPMDDSNSVVPTSSAAKAARVEKIFKKYGPTREKTKASQSPGRGDHDSAGISEQPDLPPRDGVVLSLEFTEFEPVESHHTSSTEGSDPISPEKSAVQEEILTEEQSTEVSSSPVEYLSTRRVPKRKGRHENSHSRIRVKVETISSSPIGIKALQYLDPSESIDLDEIGDKVDTPRKRRLFDAPGQVIREVSYSSQYFRHETQISGHSEQLNFRQNILHSDETPPRRRVSALQPLSTNKPILPRTSGEKDRAPKKRRIASDKDVEALVEDGEFFAVTNSTRRPTSDFSDRLDDLLQKPSPPKRVLSPVGGTDLRRKPAKSNLAREILEEEDVIARRTVTPTPSLQTSRAKYSAHHFEDSSRPSSKGSNTVAGEKMRPSKATPRLSNESSRPSSRCGEANIALSKRTPVDEFISRPSSRGLGESTRPPSRGSARAAIEPITSSRVTNRPSEEPQRPSSRSGQLINILAKRPLLDEYFARRSPRFSEDSARPSPRHSAGSGTTSTSKKRLSNQSTEQGALERDSDEEPLRARPLNTLTLHDFKVNPAFNQGFNYAFSEVVRGQAARKCLQGCTKPECCGKQFRALAEFNTNMNPDQLQTSSQEEADEILLEEFMGDNAYRVRNMTKNERDELLLQAKTRELANKFGRHRHAYERPTEPAGFWRADFPTTQEEREDQERAKKIERAAVAQRYAEAMRPGGRYIFRDE